MTLKLPTTKDVNDSIIASMEASLNQSIPLLPKAFIRVLAKVLAATFIILYKYGGYISKQMFVRTASDKDTIINGEVVNPLEEWGVLVGVGEPIAATNAELLIEVDVVSVGTLLSAGSQLVNTSTGVTYLTIGDLLLQNATEQVTVRAASDQSGGGGAGAIGNMQAGEELSFANPLPNVSSIAVVVSQVVTGANAEGTEEYRQSIFDRFQQRPQGGAYADYKLWGEQTPGIINVYPYTGQPGEVDVYSEATVASSGSADGIPTTAQLQAVLDSINFDDNGLASRRNANAFVNSLPINRVSFDVTVTGILGVEDLAKTQSDVTAALEQYFLSTEPFIIGLDVPPRNDQITSTRVSAIVEDIVTAAGGTFTSAAFNETGNPAVVDFFILYEGQKAKANSVGFA